MRLVVEDREIKVAGLFDVFKVTGKLFRFSAAADVCTLSIPVPQIKTQTTKKMKSELTG